MKITSATIRNFKGVREATLNMPQLGATKADPLHGVLGDNGAGKTTVLQAIALTLGLATRRVYALDRFPWHGFVPQRLSTMGKTRVELEVLLDLEEITATAELFAEWRKHYEKETARLVEPGRSDRLKVVLENGRVRVTDAANNDARAQLYGRFYVRQLAMPRPDLRDYFGKVGDVFWYDQYRNLGRALAMQSNGDRDDSGKEDSNELTSSGTITASRFDTEPGSRESWVVGVDQLRRFLLDWWTYHTSSFKRPGRDFIPELETLFGKVFPGTHFRGPQPIDTSGAEPSPRFFFLLERDGRVFDIAEMSSGEQAIFPLICDIVRLNVRKSVVLIDELELHLHPPEQQGLLSALPRMAPDSQFIITTHSEFVAGSIPAERKTRLLGGRLCL